MEHINETKKSELNVLRRKKRPGLMFQLWGMMMGLVVLTGSLHGGFVQVFSSNIPMRRQPCPTP